MKGRRETLRPMEMYYIIITVIKEKNEIVRHTIVMSL